MSATETTAATSSQPAQPATKVGKQSVGMRIAALGAFVLGVDIFTAISTPDPKIGGIVVLGCLALAFIIFGIGISIHEAIGAAVQQLSATTPRKD